MSQLDDYLLPRLARLDAPLLVVVGGSTGAGKSTLVNSLVRAPVSPAGVLRPTTRSPVLVCHPDDLPWFRQGELLPGLVRTAESSADPRTAAAGRGARARRPAWRSSTRRTSTRSSSATGRWPRSCWPRPTCGCSSPPRPATPTPCRGSCCTTARLRGTVIALVLDRVPPEAAGEVTAHLGEMLAAHDLGAAPLFVLPETTLDGQGLLPEDVTRPLHDWFEQLAADATARAAVVRQTVDGALAALGPAVAGLADAADDQAHGRDGAGRAGHRGLPHGAKRTVDEGLRDGRLLRGEVLARWQEFVGTGEFMRSLEARVGRLRDRVVAAVTGRPAPGRNLQAALESQLVTLLRGVAARRGRAGGRGLAGAPGRRRAARARRCSGPPPTCRERAERLVRDWQQWVLEPGPRSEAGDKRFVARGARVRGQRRSAWP